MDRDYEPLPIRELGAGAGFRRPMQAAAGRLTAGSHALDAMTDLTRATPATIRPRAPLSGANQFMITRGVRLLLVVDEEHEAVIGVITATDILGEKPMLAATERGLHHDDLTVADVMTPAARMEVLLYEDVRAARVGHIVETLRRAGRQHALVVDFDELPPLRPLAPPGHRTMVRGIFSLSQIARQLGVQMQGGGEVALTFSEVESAIR